jgi:hypothetical protein
LVGVGWIEGWGLIDWIDHLRSGCDTIAVGPQFAYTMCLFSSPTPVTIHTNAELGEANIRPVIIDVAKPESVQACLKEVRLLIQFVGVCVYRWSLPGMCGGICLLPVSPSINSFNRIHTHLSIR